MLTRVTHAGRATEFRQRLDRLIEGLGVEDIAQLQQLQPTEGWPPEIEFPTRRVEQVVLLLEEAHRAEVDDHDLESGTTAAMRTHLLARVASPPAQITDDQDAKQADDATDEGMPEAPDQESEPGKRDQNQALAEDT
jgi:hypothetical protein